jgi:Arc/MetJ family transcription regulator
LEDRAASGELTIAVALVSRLESAVTSALRQIVGLGLERLHALAAQEHLQASARRVV